MLWGEEMKKIQIYTAEDQLYKNAAALFFTLAEGAIQRKGKVQLALSGGGTPLPMYRYLVEQKDLISWQQVEVFFSDERLVPQDDPGSNYFQAVKNLLDPVGHPHDLRFAPDVTLGKERASKQYEQLILERVPLKDGIPSFDMIFLGLGTDGHIASLFPHQIGEEIFQSLVIAATAKYQNRPSLRISMTPKLINQAENVIFLLTGQEKAQAVYHSLMKGQDWRIWPASSIRAEKNNVYWFMDESAAEHIELSSGPTGYQEVES